MADFPGPPTDAADEPAETFDRVHAINLRGVWAYMKHELRHMRDQGSGAIVNCSSLGGLVGLPGRVAHHASKHGVIGLTRSTALEYVPRGIRINAICPGTIETPMVSEMIAKGELSVADAIANQPIGRFGRADEIAAAVLWLSSPAASLVVGVALPVDGDTPPLTQRGNTRGDRRSRHPSTGLCSDATSFIIGHAMIVHGGQTNRPVAPPPWRTPQASGDCHAATGVNHCRREAAATDNALVASVVPSP